MIIELASVGKVAKDIAIVFDPAEIDLEGENATLSDKAERRWWKARLTFVER